MDKFAVRLKKLREEKEFTQQELANELGLSKSAVNMYERGDRQPKFEILEQVADYFNVDTDYLLGRTNIRQKVHFDGDGTPYIPTTAAHLDIADLTQAELDEVDNFIAYVRNKRKQ